VTAWVATSIPDQALRAFAKMCPPAVSAPALSPPPPGQVWRACAQRLASCAIAEQGSGLSPQLPHDDCVTAIRAEHVRRVAFSARVDKASVPAEEGGNDDPEGKRGRHGTLE
jgi:hypothetical protein